MVMIQHFDSLFDLMEAFPTEQHAIDHFRVVRWGENNERAHCPHCGSTKISHFSNGRTHKCHEKACPKQKFSIKVGTIFEDSKIPLRKWFIAIWLLTSHKKGIASTQLAKDIKVTQKTAWFMLHRLRHAAQTTSFIEPLDGDVEVDEMYVGGESKNMHAKDRKEKGGYKNKAVVIGVVERDGDVYAEHVPAATSELAHEVVREYVGPNARFITDGSPLYRGLDPDKGGEYTNHRVVRHNRGEYVVDGDVHTNSIESIWALFKRQIIGTHHWVSKKHLQAYIDEMTWRFNRRELEEGQRVNDFLSDVKGRLMYRELIS